MATTFAPTSFPTLVPDGESIFVQMNTYIAAVVVILFLGCVFIVTGYKEPNFPWYTQVSTVVGYFCTIGIMLLVPIDVATVVISRRYNYHDPDIHQALASTYNAFFIVVLVLSNAWLCIEEYVNTDGYFTPLTRLWSSLKRFTFDTIVMIIVGLILLGILISQKAVPSNSKGLMTTIQIVTGIMYQFFLVMLLAYGLIQYPLSFWKCSNLDDYYTIVQMEISEEVKGISDSMLNASLAVSDVLKTKDALLNGDNKDAAKNDELQNAMKILLSECPEEFRSSRLGKVACDPKTGKITIDTLADLRTRLNMTKSIYKMSQTKCAKTRILAYKLEDIIAARDKNAGVITWTLQGTYSTAREKNWLCVYRGWVWKVCAVLLFLLSLLSFIGICALYPSVNMSESPYFKAINDPRNNLGAIVIFIWFTFGYTLYITLWSLFQMSFAGLMDLAPGSTTPQALSFNVRMVARLAAPLAFFYLGWIGENGMRDGDWTQMSDCRYDDDTQINKHCVRTTAFSSFYQIASVKAVKSSIGIIFPTILIVFAVLMLTGVLNKILVYCKLGDFQIGHRIATDELLREGKKHLQ